MNDLIKSVEAHTHTHDDTSGQLKTEEAAREQAEGKAAALASRVEELKLRVEELRHEHGLSQSASTQVFERSTSLGT
jgi:DNA-binding transcriptional regulator YiaG